MKFAFATNILVVSSLIAFLLGGIYVIVFNVEFNKCQMTYMFEWPEYVHIPMRKKVIEEYPNYKLFVYGEGQYTYYLKAQSYSGIPVLFIPGNSGSHKQVRSLASVALQMAKSRRTAFHFNYFAVDFNEELGALYGGFLMKQIDFSKHAINHIFSLYPTSKKPSSVIIIGHSMGGIVAKGILLDPKFDKSKISLIVTLASPHNRPVVNIDSVMHILYKSLHKNMANFSDIPMLSISGGSRDIQVQDELAALPNKSENHQYISSTAIPGIWASSDHLCICWCKQIILAINRALFQIVDEKTAQVTRQKHVIKKSIVQHVIKSKPEIGRGQLVKFPSSDRWQAKTKLKFFTFEREQLKETFYFKIGPIQLRSDREILITANESSDSWLFVCENEGDFKDGCVEGRDVSFLAENLPPSDLNRKVFRLSERNAKQLVKSRQYLVVRLEPTDKQVELFYEEYAVQSRYLTLELPDWFALAMPQTLLGLPFHRINTAKQEMHYRFNIPELSHVRQGYYFSVVVQKCLSRVGTVGLISMTTPWNGGFTHDTLYYWQNATLPLAVTSTREDVDKRSVEVSVLLDPTCTYTISMGLSWPNMAAQFVRFYGNMLPTFALIHIINSFGAQLAMLAEGTAVKNIQAALKDGIRPFIFLPIALIIDWVMRVNGVGHYSDFHSLSQSGISFALLPHLLWVISMVPFHLVCLILRLFVEVFTVFLRLIPVHSGGLFGKLANSLFCVLAMCSAVFVNSGLSLLILLIVQLSKTSLSLKLARTAGNAFDNFQINFGVLIIMAWILLLNGGILAVFGMEFIKANKPFSDLANLRITQLFADPSIWMAVCCCVLLAFPIFINDCSFTGSNHRMVYCSRIIQLFLVFIPLFGSTVYHQASYFLLFTLILYTGFRCWASVKPGKSKTA